jgi:hypothetical protein
MTPSSAQSPINLAGQSASQHSPGALCTAGDMDGRLAKEDTVAVTMYETNFRISVTPPTSGERALAREIKGLWTLLRDQESKGQFTDPELEAITYFLGEKLRVYEGTACDVWAW